MKWIKLKDPRKAQLIHDCDLELDGKILISASKENPVAGTITHYGCKKIGRNDVCMYKFFPDIAPDKFWEFSRKWLRIIIF